MRTREKVIDLILAGAAEKVSAQEEVRRICALSGMPAAGAKKVVTELFSPPRVSGRITNESRRSGLSPGTSFDLIVNADSGEQWDFLKADDRRSAGRGCARSTLG